MQLLDRRYLSIYLNDHLAGATAGLELARRSEGSNRGTELGEMLAQIGHEIEEDRERLREVMAALEIEEDGLKKALAWSGEKLSRLKPNGELSFTAYSPLSRLTELEGLTLGVSGKLYLWRNLQRALGDRLAHFDLPELIARAESQLERLEEQRLQVAAEVLAE